MRKNNGSVIGTRIFNLTSGSRSGIWPLYVQHTESTSNAWPRLQYLVDVLVIAGGGSGASTSSGRNNEAGGGGGAGGYLYSSGLEVDAKITYTIAVGAGGVADPLSTFGNDALARPGSNSSFTSSIYESIAIGGGGGGGNYRVATPGGSGGGGSRARETQGAAGIPGQGFAGGSANPNTSGGGGGGGGSGGVGSFGSNGIGGIGTSSTITGTAVTRAAGGSGAYASSVPAGGAGGPNGSASVNTGSGGGGGVANGGQGGNGGSGVVILRFANNIPAPNVVGTHTTIYDGDFQARVFTGSGSITFS